jgi:hypothetical protein
MKLTLTYDGELGSNSNYRDKWEIRKKISPQLEELWQGHYALKALQRHRYVSTTDAYMKWEIHHSADHILAAGTPSAAKSSSAAEENSCPW